MASVKLKENARFFFVEELRHQFFLWGSGIPFITRMNGSPELFISKDWLINMFKKLLHVYWKSSDELSDNN